MVNFYYWNGPKLGIKNYVAVSLTIVMVRKHHFGAANSSLTAVVPAISSDPTLSSVVDGRFLEY